MYFETAILYGRFRTTITMHAVGLLIYTTVGSEYDAAIDYYTDDDTSVCLNATCQYVCECVVEETHTYRDMRACVIQ